MHSVGHIVFGRLEVRDMKKWLREEALQQRNGLSLTERREKSEKITAHILESCPYQKAQRVFVFVSMGSEVETREILRRAWQDGKTVAVPKTAKGRQMFFLPITDFADLQEGIFGVMEPMGDERAEILPQTGDLFLVPGLLFDKRGYRIGYGGGYYDRYFEKHQGLDFRKIGIAFAFQLWEAPLPAEEFDVPIDELVTEKGWNGGVQK